MRSVRDWKKFMELRAILWGGDEVTDYIPTTEEMRKIFSEFDSWLEQHDQAKELEIREQVAQEIEDSTINFNTYNAYEVRNICASIARGDSK